MDLFWWENSTVALTSNGYPMPLLRCRRFVFPVIALAVVVGIPTLSGSAAAATATAGPGATGNSAFGKIVDTVNINVNVDAVAPGHTHKACVLVSTVPSPRR